MIFFTACLFTQRSGNLGHLCKKAPCSLLFEGKFGSRKGDEKHNNTTQIDLTTSNRPRRCVSPARSVGQHRAANSNCPFRLLPTSHLNNKIANYDDETLESPTFFSFVI